MGENGRFFDALRPSIEPDGLETSEEVVQHRQLHLSRVRKLFESLDVFIFTLGLTEMWIDQKSGTAYPTAPGTVAGFYDPNTFAFSNARYNEIIDDFNSFQKVVMTIRQGRPFNILLTVSPVPLTATALKTDLEYVEDTST